MFQTALPEWERRAFLLRKTEEKYIRPEHFTSRLLPEETNIRFCFPILPTAPIPTEATADATE